MWPLKRTKYFNLVVRLCIININEWWKGIKITLPSCPHKPQKSLPSHSDGVRGRAVTFSNKNTIIRTSKFIWKSLTFGEFVASPTIPLKAPASGQFKSTRARRQFLLAFTKSRKHRDISSNREVWIQSDTGITVLIQRLCLLTQTLILTTNETDQAMCWVWVWFNRQNESSEGIAMNSAKRLF